LNAIDRVPAHCPISPPSCSSSTPISTWYTFLIRRPAGGAALLSKTVDLAVNSISVAKPQINAGTMKGLAVSGGERWPELSDVPTIAEAGVPAALADIWQGIMVPAGTPRDVVDRLGKALIEIVKRPQIRKAPLDAGFSSTGRGATEFHRRIVDEVPKWKDVITKALITAQ
jgi:tripartite-type tricarboxylate transporter receptor subunit TctC